MVGKPVIGAINGSCSNFIINNQIGYTCKAQDHEALAKLILELDEQDLKRIGKNSREVYFRKYSKDKFINKLIETLKDNVK